jgi:hypothetical protein
VIPSLLAAALLAASPLPDRADAGVALRAGAQSDGGRDAGPSAVPDGGDEAADAGRVVLAHWQRGDGGLFDGGVTDVISLSVDASLDVAFLQQVTFMLCDDPLVVRADVLAERIVLNGVAPGATHCGFWFNRGSIPSRYISVVVLDLEGSAEAQRASAREEPAPKKEAPPVDQAWQYDQPAFPW